MADSIPDGMILVRNTDPLMAGQKVTVGSTTYKLDHDGRCLFPQDCGIHLCGAEWDVESGTPKVRIVKTADGVTFRPLAGPMTIWRAEKEMAGGRITAPDGTVLTLNHQSLGAAPLDCGLMGVPGYEMVMEATPEAMKQLGVHPPTTVTELQESLEAERLERLGIGTVQEEDDPYAAFIAEMAAKPIVPARPEDLAVATGKPDPYAELEGKTKAELIAIAAEVGIEDAGNKHKFGNKAKLVAAILAAHPVTRSPQPALMATSTGASLVATILEIAAQDAAQAGGTDNPDENDEEAARQAAREAAGIA